MPTNVKKKIEKYRETFYGVEIIKKGKLCK